MKSEDLRRHAGTSVSYRPLGDLIRFRRGAQLSDTAREVGAVPVVTAGRAANGVHSNSNVPGPAVTISSHGAYVGHVSFWPGPIWLANNVLLADRLTDSVDTRYLYFLLKHREESIGGLAQTGGVPYVNGRDILRIRVPLPSLETQRQIVRTLNPFTELIAEVEAESEARRAQFAVYRARLLSSSRDNDRVSVSQVLEAVPAPRGVLRQHYSHGTRFPIVDQGQGFVVGYTDDKSRVVSGGPFILFGDHTRQVKWVDFDFALGADGVRLFRPARGVDARYVYHALCGLEIPSRGYNRHWTTVRDMEIGLPSVEEQRHVAEILDKFDTLLNDLVIGLPAELAARRKQYEYYRDKLLTFEEAPA